MPPSSFPLDIAAKYAGRPDQQDDKQQAEGNCIAKIGRQVSNAHYLRKTQNQSTKYSASDIPHAAQNDHGDSPMHNRSTHESMNGIEIDSRQHSGSSAQSRSRKSSKLKNPFYRNASNAAVRGLSATERTALPHFVLLSRKIMINIRERATPTIMICNK